MPRKLTHEQFMEKFNIKNTHAHDIEILGTYVNNKTKILCKCKLHGYEWSITPSNLLNGQGCPICGRETAIQKQTKTHEQFIKELQEVNPDIEVLGTYINLKTKIKCRCRLDGHEWKTLPKDLLRGHGCPKCVKITHEEFLDKFNKQNKHAKDIEILGTYKTTLTKIKCKCKVCNHIWETTPHSLLRGRGCHKCGGTKKKTHEQFIQELYKINENIQVLSTYKGAHTPIKCKCKIDEYEWEVKPHSLLSGYGCPKCKITKRTKTHEQFLQELKQINPDIEVLGTYVNGKTKILCKCKLDGYEWEARPKDLLRGIGCPKCGGTLKKTHEQFIQELEQINPNIQVLGTYVNDRTKIKCKCRLDGHIWEPTPATLLNGTGCPKCATQNLTKTHEQFIQELYKINENIQVLSTYKNSYTPIKCRCKLDGHIWETTPNSILSGYGCPKCAINNKRKTHAQFLQEFKTNNKYAQDIEILGTYVNALTKIKCKCKLDGHIWEAWPNSLLSGYGCPKCKISKGEKRVAQYLDNLGIEYIYNTCYFNDLVGVSGGLMRPDFIIPSLRLWIEYDGKQHFAPVNFKGAMSEQQVQEQFEYTQQNDQIKNQYAEQHNWTLIRIPYWDYDNIEKILDSYLKQEEELAL